MRRSRLGIAGFRRNKHLCSRRKFKDSPRLCVHESPGNVIVKYADGKPHIHRQRSVVVFYQFEDSSSCDKFQVIDLSGSFDYILRCRGLYGIVQKSIGSIERTVQLRYIDVNAVLVVLADPLSVLQHVAVVNSISPTFDTREACDSPLLAV